MKRGLCAFAMLVLFIAAFAEEETISYTYDDAGRLIQADYGNGRVITYVYDAAGNILQQSVVAPQPCSLACEAVVTPAEGISPLEVAGTAAATATNCTGEVSYAWDMGDGATYAEQNPTHTYGPGTHAWTMMATVEGQICTATGTVTVGRIPGDCDGLGTVTIGEVQKAINMFLGIEPPSCGVDCDGSGAVSIGEVQKVINAFLGLDVNC